MEAEKRWASVFPSPLLCLWRRGEEICGVPSTLITASLLRDKDKGPKYSPLDSYPRAGARDPLGECSTK